MTPQDKIVNSIRQLIGESVTIPNHKERSRIPMLNWLPEAAEVLKKYGITGVETSKLLILGLALASTSEPVDREQIVTALSAKTGLRPRVLKNQIKEIVLKRAKGSSAEFQEELAASAPSFESRFPAYSEAVATEGPPLYVDSRGGLYLNQLFFVRLFKLAHKVVYVRGEGQFLVYDEGNGRWGAKSEAALKSMFSEDFFRLFSGSKVAARIMALRNDRFLSGCVRLLMGGAEKISFFRQADGDCHYIHLAESVLKIGPDLDLEICRFSPDFCSRNQIPISLQPEARCPRFLDELLRRQLDDDDINLLQRYLGLLLLRINPSHRILVIHGPGGGGKTTVCETFEGIIGVDNIAELRTRHLGDRFEISSFFGKSLLVGKDVEGTFLQHAGAHNLKKLVGHDMLSGEKKGVNERSAVRGEFNVMINCNSRLRVRLDGDVDAWRRRLMIIEFGKQKVEKPIPNFARMLVAEEGPGILLWGIGGAIKLLKELRAHGDLVLSDRQRERVDKLLLESDSVAIFVQDCIGYQSGDVTTSELVAAYFEYCTRRGWIALSPRLVENQLPDVLANRFMVQRVNDILRHGRSSRGYRGIGLKSQEEGYELL